MGSVAHSGLETMFCANLIAQKVFALARAGELKIPGFPKFEEAISELKGKAFKHQPTRYAWL